VAEAKTHFQNAVEAEPNNPQMCNDLAWLLATCWEASLRNGPKAVELAQQAEMLSGGKDPEILETLAAAYAEASRFGEAVETAQRAVELANARTNAAQAGRIRQELELYTAGLPFHASTPTNDSVISTRP
jgi:Flp pilus assembly protein TadD